jgi:hypothetical protein
VSRLLGERQGRPLALRNVHGTQAWTPARRRHLRCYQHPGRTAATYRQSVSIGHLQRPAQVNDLTRTATEGPRCSGSRSGGPARRPVGDPGLASTSGCRTRPKGMAPSTSRRRRCDRSPDRSANWPDPAADVLFTSDPSTSGDPEGGSPARPGAGHAELPAVGLHEGLGYGRTNARAFVCVCVTTVSGRIDSVEAFGHVRQMLAGDTAPVSATARLAPPFPGGVRAETVTVPPDGVCRNALSSRFPRT